MSTASISRSGQDLGYDADKDFTYISQLISVPMGMFTSAKKPNCARCQSSSHTRRPTPVNLRLVDRSGNAASLAVEWLKAMAGIDVLIVNFRGIPQGIQALVGREADLMFMGIGSAADGFIAQGQMHQIGIATRQRLAKASQRSDLYRTGHSGLRTDFLVRARWSCRVPSVAA